MKFIYEYRTSDNARHQGVINAANREAAFITLKAQGIRPGSVVDAPGVWNKILGRGKRWIAIGLLGCAVVVLVLANMRQGATSASAVFDDMTRRQVIGDAAVIELGVKTGWANVFDGEGERFLASFAIPGARAGVRSTTEEEILAALGRRVEIESWDTIENRQIKSMVEGMKAELRAFISKGGSVVSYGRRLVARQEEESRCYQLSKNEVDAAVREGLADAEVLRLWNEKNEQLRKMGIKPLPMPK